MIEIKSFVQSQFQNFVSGDSLLDDSQLASVDDSWMDWGSPTKIVLQDASIFIGGISSLLIQAANPYASAVVNTQSTWKNDPQLRLQLTGKFLASTILGSCRQAEQEIRKVNAIHSHIPPVVVEGKKVSPSDPELVTWVGASEIWSFWKAFEIFSSYETTSEMCDCFVSDMSFITERLGGNRFDSWNQLVRWLSKQNVSYGVHGIDLVNQLVDAPVPLKVKPFYYTYLFESFKIVDLFPNLNFSQIDFNNKVKTNYFLAVSSPLKHFSGKTITNITNYMLK